MIMKCNKSAKKLLEMIVEDFPSFRDVAVFENREGILYNIEQSVNFLFLILVALYKRAQILIADTWACCGGKGLGEFHDIDAITMFADYRCGLFSLVFICFVWFLHICVFVPGLLGVAILLCF
jgi:hypothetical protein